MFGLPRLYVLLGLFLAGVLVGSVGIWQVQAWRFKSIEHDRQVAQQRDTLKRQERADEAAASHEDFKAKEDVRHVERVKIVRQLVDRPVYRNVCIDGDGLRELNAAIRGQDPGQPAPAVPGPAKP